MRFLVKAKWPVEKANHLARHGELGKSVQSIVEDLNPEAAYFYTDEGKRTALMVIDLQDASELPRIAELEVPTTNTPRNMNSDWLRTRSNRFS